MNGFTFTFNIWALTSNLATMIAEASTNQYCNCLSQDFTLCRDRLALRSCIKKAKYKHIICFCWESPKSLTSAARLVLTVRGFNNLCIKSVDLAESWTKVNKKLASGKRTKFTTSEHEPAETMNFKTQRKLTNPIYKVSNTTKRKTKKRWR